MLLSHDVIAHEVYSEQSLAVRASPSPVGQFANGVGGGTGGVSTVGSDPGADLADASEPDMEMDNVTRVRLVQFQKNSDEPMVSVIAVISARIFGYWGILKLGHPDRYWQRCPGASFNGWFSLIYGKQNALVTSLTELWLVSKLSVK